MTVAPPAKAVIGVTPGSGWVAEGIRIVTRSPYAHAFIATGVGDQIVEAEPEGARYGHASEYSTVKWLTHLGQDLTDPQRDLIVAWAEARTTGYGPNHDEGIPYSWKDDAAIGLRDLWPHWVPGWLKRQLGSNTTLMCSQLCVAAYRAGGVDLYPGLPDGGVSPGDLNRLDEARAKALR